MKPNPVFLKQTPEFWAYVRTVSQEVGYTERGKSVIKIPNIDDVKRAFKNLNLSLAHITSEKDKPTEFGKTLFAYFKYRASVLNNDVQNQLMDKTEAGRAFLDLKKRLNPTCKLPMNKQKGTKKNHAFLTCIVNMLIEAGIQDAPCDYDPRSLTTITHNRMPLRTLARRVDGAFPSVVDPIAIWEIKEYYYTTTFGSRVADGVYETLLDGMERAELQSSTHRKIAHVLFIDDKFTWWVKGRSYLCRIVDLLHMGYVDEVIFGREVLTRLPAIASEWLADYRHSAAFVSGNEA
jgi:hypothetical protein